MKNYLNKKASFELSSQMTLWFPRIIFLIVFILVVTAPLGCVSQNKQVQLYKVQQSEADLILFQVKNCLEKVGLEKKELTNCINKTNVGLKVISDTSSFSINENILDKELCNINKKHVCKNEKYFLKINNELKEVSIEMVVINE